MDKTLIVFDYDIVSFFVALALAFYSYTKYSESSLGNRAFKRMVFCVILVCLSDFFSCLAIKLRAGSFLETFVYSTMVFNSLSFSQSIFAYTNAYIHTKEKAVKHKKFMTRFFFPAIALTLLANAFFGFLFYVDDDFSIRYQKAFIIVPLAFVSFSVASAAQLGRNAQKFTKTQVSTLCAIYEATIAFPFIQIYLCPQFRISPFAFTFLTTALLFSIETPDDQTLLTTINELEVLQRTLKASVEKKTVAAREKREKIERLATQMTRALVETIDAKDRYTSGHSARVARYSKMLAQRKGLPPEKCQQIFMMGLLHDIGKVGVPTSIINKPGRLTDKEFAQMKAHPIIGSSILEKVSIFPELRSGARWHHERPDGRGYPDGLFGDQIPLEAKIIAVADAYDAMTSSRSYRPIMPQEAVREQIVNGFDSQFDKEIASYMVELIDEDLEYNLHEFKKQAEAQKC